MLNLFIVFSIVMSFGVGFLLGKDSRDSKIIDLEEDIKKLKEENKRLRE